MQQNAIRFPNTQQEIQWVLGQLQTCVSEAICSDNTTITRPTCDRYNCVAHCLHLEDHWLWPGYNKDQDRLWPPCSDSESVEAFQEFFAQLGYGVYDSGEPVFSAAREYIALYTGMDGKVVHMSHISGCGQWRNKLRILWNCQNTTQYV